MRLPHVHHFNSISGLLWHFQVLKKEGLQQISQAFSLEVT